MSWIKLHCEKWFIGSTRWELEPDERSVWTDFIVRAGLNEPRGQINFFSYKQLAVQMNISLELLKRSIEKFRMYKKIEIIEDNQKQININNWDVYQSEYSRQKKYRDKIQFDIEKSKFLNFTDELKKIYQEKFPAVNLPQEIKKMEAWLMSNPKNRKSNYERFVANWLSRAQDKTRPEQSKKSYDAAGRELKYID